MVLRLRQVLAKGLLGVGPMWLLMLIGSEGIGVAQFSPTPPIDSLQTDSPPPLFTIWPDWLELAGEFEIETTHDTHLALGTTSDDDQTRLTPQLTLEVGVKSDERVQGFLQLELSSDIILDAVPEEQTRVESPVLKLKEAFVSFEHILDSDWSLRLGRQLFEDSRQWLFDDELDALRLIYQPPRIHLDIAIAREGLFTSDLIKRTTERSSDYYWLYGQDNAGQERLLAAYSLIQHDRPSDLHLAFLGLRSQGELAPDLSYWLDLAHVRGKEEGRTVRGWGLDVGFLSFFDRPLHPFLSGSFAFGSGDDTPEDKRDTAFRQTGLHGNATELESVVDFQYYGELFDPELSNLLIFTVGTGLRPLPDTSFTLMYHHYQQHKATDTLREARITAEPTGRSRNLGHELDFIGGWVLGRFEFTLILGAFWPGSAFTGTDPFTFFAQGRVRIAFE